MTQRALLLTLKATGLNQNDSYTVNPVLQNAFFVNIVMADKVAKKLKLNGTKRLGLP